MLVRPEDFARAIERVFMINKEGNPGIPPVYAGGPVFTLAGHLAAVGCG